MLYLADSVYARCGDDVYGLRVFGKEFFEDYLKVFDSVVICAREEIVDRPPAGRPQVTSDRIRFIGIPNVHGWKWMMGINQQSRKTLEESLAIADAVVARVPSSLGEAGMYAARRVGKPFLGEVVGDPWDSISNYGSNPIYKLFALWYFYRFQRFVKGLDMASYVSRRVLERRYPAHADAATEEYSSIRLPGDFILSPRTYKNSPRPIAMLCLSSFLGYKRHVDLINACSVLKQRSIPFTLHLVGDGPTQSQIRKKVAYLGITEDVVFHGYIADPRLLLEKIDACHVTVVPSAQEGLPRSMLEGMARGLGAIGSDVGGIPDLTRDSESFATGDYERLADILTEVATDPGRLSEMSAHAIGISQNYTSRILSPRRVRMYTLLRDRVSRP
ncbi:glycosyltransferase family 4 protein [Aporhodopirellula aestuarii]|uniref:glycosyltransferase family 4 protein n=1 Tax=Aporhodopirellula aestuarii TaxID=2950107 RepID=UPI002033FB6E|nr:glycosyltransferase family 4 protein [Aporhodopirellula aestuarii]